MRKQTILMVCVFVALMVLYNVPVFVTTEAAREFWQRPILGFVPASIAYYLVWIALTVPFGWWLLRLTWRDAR